MFDNDLESDENIQESSGNSEYSEENLKHLKRLEQDFLNDLEFQKFVKSWLETIMFNTMNVFITLWLINTGVSILLSVLGGFTIGSVPAMKAIADNFSISREESWTVNMNGKLLNGVIKLILAGTLTWFGAASEWSSIQKMARMSAEQFEIERENYEKDKRDEFNPELKWLLATGLGAAGAVMVLGFLKDTTKDL